jgi:hypothetical protein
MNMAVSATTEKWTLILGYSTDHIMVLRRFILENLLVVMPYFGVLLRYSSIFAGETAMLIALSFHASPTCSSVEVSVAV